MLWAFICGDFEVARLRTWNAFEQKTEYVSKKHAYIYIYIDTVNCRMTKRIEMLRLHPFFLIHQVGAEKCGSLFEELGSDFCVKLFTVLGDIWVAELFMKLQLASEIEGLHFLVNIFLFQTNIAVAKAQCRGTSAKRISYRGSSRKVALLSLLTCCAAWAQISWAAFSSSSAHTSLRSKGGAITKNKVWENRPTFLLTEQISIQVFQILNSDCKK